MIIFNYSILKVIMAHHSPIYNECQTKGALREGPVGIFGWVTRVREYPSLCPRSGWTREKRFFLASMIFKSGFL